MLYGLDLASPYLRTYCSSMRYRLRRRFRQRLLNLQDPTSAFVLWLHTAIREFQDRFECFDQASIGGLEMMMLTTFVNGSVVGPYPLLNAATLAYLPLPC